MPSKVVSALLLLSLTLIGAGFLYAAYSSYSKAFEPGPRKPVLRFVSEYNETHDVYLVVSGCLDGVQVLVYNASTGSWQPGSRACSGSLVVLPLSVGVEVGVVEGR